MKSVKFWRMEVKQLSLTERIFFKDAINTLLAWEALKGEYLELDLIKRIVESEIRFNTSEVKADKKSAGMLFRTPLPT